MRIVVIGGGPAGMMAAISSAETLAGSGEVVLLEQNEKLGKKLYITGKGRCNVTNTASGEDFFANVPRNARFLRSAHAALDAQGLMAFFARLGLETMVERGGRVFPASEKASDVTRALERELGRLGVRVRLGARVSRLLTGECGVSGVALDTREMLMADAVIVATGGVSYPSTGSTGDGWRLAQSVGLATEPPRASLVGIETRDAWPKSLSGLTLKNVRLCARVGSKTVFDELGELLLTHFGVSGPLVLTLSSLIADVIPANVDACIDFKPGMTPEEVDARLVREFAAAPNKQVVTLLAGWLPERLAEEFTKAAAVPAQSPVHQITRAQRKELAGRMKRMPLGLSVLRPINEAVITRGGVSVKEINPSTLEAKTVPGLYFAGELLDVDALTGGFNLQIAFSTGMLAGRSAARAER